MNLHKTLTLFACLLLSSTIQATTCTKIEKSEARKIVAQQAQINNIDKHLIEAIIQTESAFNNCAISPKGAIGLMQLMPSTAESMNLNPQIPSENIKAGIIYFKKMHDKFKNTSLALAAYNAGPNAVIKHKGIPPYNETQQYVRKVLKLYNKKQKSWLVLSL